MKVLLKKIWAPLLIAVLLLKISAFHVYEHQDSTSDESSHCELCIISVNSPNAEGTFTESFEVKRPFIEVPEKTQISSWNADKSDSLEELIHCTRPPPALFV